MSTETRTKNMRAFHATLNQLGLMDDKRYLIERMTNGRTNSARELTDQELCDMVAHLNSKQPYNEPYKLPGDKMRKAIISMAHEMGWRLAGKADMQRINNWCVAKGKYHKKLNDHNMQELTELVSQFQIVYQKHLKTV